MSVNDLALSDKESFDLIFICKNILDFKSSEIKNLLDKLAKSSNRSLSSLVLMAKTTNGELSMS